MPCVVCKLRGRKKAAVRVVSSGPRRDADMGNGGDGDGDDARRSSPPCPPVVAAQRVMDGKRVQPNPPTHPPGGQGEGRGGEPGLSA